MSVVPLRANTARIDMFIVGLTGGLATGKSTVLSIFRENGIAVIDADEVARKGSVVLFLITSSHVLIINPLIVA